jgi:hypothetical protein
MKNGWAYMWRSFGFDFPGEKMITKTQMASALRNMRLPRLLYFMTGKTISDMT